MRPGIIIAIIAAAAVLIGSVIWYNNSQAEHARLELQQTEEAAQIARDADAAREVDAARDEERARQQEEAAAAEQAAWDAQEAERAADEAAAAQDEDAIADDDPIVLGDAITEDTIVVESASDEPTILRAADTATSVEIINDEDPAATPDSAGDTDTGIAATDPEELLTPENFARDEVLALIDASQELSADDRSSLRAMVEGASTNPAMVEATIISLRDALDLPPLN